MGFLDNLGKYVSGKVNAVQEESNRAYEKALRSGSIKCIGDMMERGSFSEKSGYQRAMKELAADCSDFDLQYTFKYFYQRNNQLALKSLYYELEARGLAERSEDGHIRKIGNWE